MSHVTYSAVQKSIVSQDNMDTGRDSLRCAFPHREEDKSKFCKGFSALRRFSHCNTISFDLNFGRKMGALFSVAIVWRSLCLPSCYYFLLFKILIAFHYACMQIFLFCGVLMRKKWPAAIFNNQSLLNISGV
jgi:hypothetical protein